MDYVRAARFLEKKHSGLVAALAGTPVNVPVPVNVPDLLGLALRPLA
jgi:hypothetical protein